MAISSKRAEYTAAASLAMSVVFFGLAFFMGRWSGFFAVYAVSWLILSAALIWLVLWIQFHQRWLAEQEKLDMSQLALSEQAGTIFQAKGERATLFAVAQHRLQLLEKWFLPIFSAVIAIYQAGTGLYLLKARLTISDIDTKEPLLCAVCMTGVAFVSFLMSRYAIGMAVQHRWKPLRAGGSSLLAVAVLCFLLAISLALAQFQLFVGVNIIGLAAAVLLIILGAETA